MWVFQPSTCIKPSPVQFRSASLIESPSSTGKSGQKTRLVWTSLTINLALSFSLCRSLFNWNEFLRFYADLSDPWDFLETPQWFCFEEGCCCFLLQDEVTSTDSKANYFFQTGPRLTAGYFFRLLLSKSQFNREIFSWRKKFHSNWS